MKNTRPPKVIAFATTAIFLATLGFSVAAQTTGDGFQAINPSSLPPAHGYSHVTIAPVGKLVTISGQVAMDSKGNIIGRNSFEAQCNQVFKNIRNALHAVGLTFSNVTKTDMLVTSLKHLSDLRECRKRYLPSENPPAANLAVVRSLFRPALMLEISVQAVIPAHAQAQ